MIVNFILFVKYKFILFPYYYTCIFYLFALLGDYLASAELILLRALTELFYKFNKRFSVSYSCKLNYWMLSRIVLLQVGISQLSNIQLLIKQS